MLVSVKGTFLDTECASKDTRRTKSAEPRSSRQCLNPLEQATIDSLNELMPALQKVSCSNPSTATCPKGWDCQAQCGVFPAGNRAKWLAENRGLSLLEARLQVMREFPTAFGRPRTLSNSSLNGVSVEDWDCEIFCGGRPSRDRANTLVKIGMSLDDAQLRVMQEFPTQFGRRRHQRGSSAEPSLEEDTAEKIKSVLSLEGWDCEAQCGIFPAGDRAKWLAESSGLSLYEARLRVMREFPTAFGRKRSLSNCSWSTVSPEDWDCEEFCGGRPSRDRAMTLVKIGMSVDAAQLRVMQEFPTQFRQQEDQSVVSEVSEDTSADLGPALEKCFSDGSPGSTLPDLSDADSVMEEADRSVEDLGSPLDAARLRVLQEALAQRDVPGVSNFAAEFSETDVEAPPTTMMVRNIPNKYGQQELIDELGGLGYQGSFDFFYAPKDFRTMQTRGYAFINFISNEWAMRFQQELEGYVFQKYQGKARKKSATVSVAELQGLEPNIRHFEKAAVSKRGIAKRCDCGPVVLLQCRSAAVGPGATAE